MRANGETENKVAKIRVIVCDHIHPSFHPRRGHTPIALLNRQEWWVISTFFGLRDSHLSYADTKILLR